MGEIKNGRVKWFDRSKGFGFFVPDDGTDDVFLHKVELKRVGVDDVAPGTIMSCECYDDGGRWKVREILTMSDSATGLQKQIDAANKILAGTARVAARIFVMLSDLRRDHRKMSDDDVEQRVDDVIACLSGSADEGGEG